MNQDENQEIDNVEQSPQPQEFSQKDSQEQQNPGNQEKKSFFSGLLSSPIKMALIGLVLLAIVFGLLYVFKPSIVMRLLSFGKKGESCCPLGDATS